VSTVCLSGWHGHPRGSFLRAARRFAASRERRAILAFGVPPTLWAGASTVNFFACGQTLSNMDEYAVSHAHPTCVRVTSFMVMREARRRAWALVVSSAVAYVAILLLGLGGPPTKALKLTARVGMTDTLSQRTAA